MLRNITHWAFIIAGYLLMSGYNACDPIITNNGFDLWCGDELCDWDTEFGEIARTPTWHGNDDGVDLIGGSVAISQVSDISTGNVTCMRFDMVAKIEETAVVTLELDFFDDGSVDWSRQIPTSDWASLSYLITMPVEYQGVRFRIKKLGNGRAVVAQLQAEKADKCVEPAVVLPPKPLGANCASVTDCTSGKCAARSPAAPRVCVECIDDTDCEAGDVCGLDLPRDATFLSMARTCGPAGRHQLGEQCIVDAECSTGICGSRGMCAGCASVSDCPGEEQCEYPPTISAPDTLTWQAPRQCSPEQGTRAPGETCLVDADCASQTCLGRSTLQVCYVDGRRCAGDEDCPGEFGCLSVGALDGQCQ